MNATQNKKLHILHTEASCGWGGQEIRILTESKAFIANGHQITLICNEKSEIYTKAKALGMTTISLNIFKKRPASLLAVMSWLRMNAKNIDVINTHSSTDSWLFALANTILRTNIPIVRSRHISAPINQHYSTKWLYTKATSHIVTTGKKLKRTLIEENKYPEHMITSIPTGIDVNLFFPQDKTICQQELGIPKDKFVIGIVATIRSWKGHEYLVDAFYGLNNPEAYLVIVGDGPNKKRIEQQVSDLKLQDHVLFAGQQENICTWLNALDLFVLPSFANEGVPQSIMQAMLCKIPVISTDVGSVTEIVDNENTGLIANIKDAEDLKQKILIMQNNEQSKVQYTKNACNLIKNEYSSINMYNAMLQVFLNSIR